MVGKSVLFGLESFLLVVGSLEEESVEASETEHSKQGPEVLLVSARREDDLWISSTFENRESVA